jgi:hypothetical protein
MGSVNANVQATKIGAPNGDYAVTRDELVDLITKYRAAGGGEYHPEDDFDDYCDTHCDDYPGGHYDPALLERHKELSTAVGGAAKNLAEAIVAYCEANGSQDSREAVSSYYSIIHDRVMYQVMGVEDDGEYSRLWIRTTVLDKVLNIPITDIPRLVGEVFDKLKGADPSFSPVCPSEDFERLYVRVSHRAPSTKNEVWVALVEARGLDWFPYDEMADDEEADED